MGVQSQWYILHGSLEVINEVARIEEVKRKSGIVWVVYNNADKVVILTRDRSMAKKFIEIIRGRRPNETS